MRGSFTVTVDNEYASNLLCSYQYARIPLGPQGTSYTITNTEVMSNATTASNYAIGFDPLTPVRPEFTQNGPFLHSPNKPLPSAYVLTKTHCAGYCMQCQLSWRVDAFEQACLTGQKSVDGETIKTTYSKSIPKKAVHIIRNPFDNLVGRQHLAMKKRQRRGSVEEVFPSSKEGMQSWCEFLDSQPSQREIDSNFMDDGMLKRYQDLPCLSEWYRYIQWNNLAIQVTQRLQLPVHVMYYEDYSDNYAATVKDLFRFLELPIVQQPLEFIPGKSYASFFDRKDAKLAARMVRELATPDAWLLLRHYFEGLLDDLDASPNLLSSGGDDTSRRTTQPEVAWLISYPNSGTSYTITNTEKISNKSTASNYAGGWDALIPVRPELTNGPFLHDANLEIPSNVLTKTHCTGYCFDCAPAAYVKTVDSFEKGCATGQKDIDGSKTQVSYSSTVPEKIVHLIRNPFDNLVGRIHLGIKKRRQEGQSEEELAQFQNSKEGVQAWCNHFDPKFVQKELNSPLLDQTLFRRFQSLPCRAEWFRYVQWHNLATELTKRRRLPTHVFYYEDYTADYNGTVQQLFDFLDLPIVQEPLYFIPGKTYTHFYDTEDARAAAHFVRELATPDAWMLLRHYFIDLLDDSEMQPKLQLTSGIDRNLDTTETRPAVAWLMSFPNSGTSYTITNTEKMSNASTASNYAKDWDPVVAVREELTNGPFLHKPFGNVPKYVLTKTHCSGYCDECGLDRSVQTVDDFEKGCTLGHTPGGVVTYATTVPEKAVHLIRNPFDNIVARMHLAVKQRKRERGWSAEQAAAFKSKEGFQSWCTFVDEKFDNADKDSPLIDRRVRKLLNDVPCRGDWFRYVQWHNLAIETTKRLNLPVHILYYESYTVEYDETVDRLFEFLELPKVNEPHKFVPGKTYSDYFDVKQTRAAKRLVRALATPDCWALLRPYFEDDSAGPDK